MKAAFAMVKEMQMPPHCVVPEGSVGENCLLLTLLKLNAAVHVEGIAHCVEIHAAGLLLSTENRWSTSSQCAVSL